MKIHDLPAHKRPREKLREKGTAGLSPTELLAILLRTGYQGQSALDIAQHLLKRYTLVELQSLPLDVLAKTKGVGFSRAVQVKAALALGELAVQTQELPTVTTPETVYQLCHSIRDKKQEHLICLYLNARNQLITLETISVGTLNSSLLHPREIYAPALTHRAASLIVVHNHPSGNTQPSEEDILVTEKLVEAGEILDIPLVDHVIISQQRWTSLKQENLI